MRAVAAVGVPRVSQPEYLRDAWIRSSGGAPADRSVVTSVRVVRGLLRGLGSGYDSAGILRISLPAPRSHARARLWSERGYRAYARRASNLMRAGDCVALHALPAAPRSLGVGQTKGCLTGACGQAMKSSPRQRKGWLRFSPEIGYTSCDVQRAACSSCCCLYSH